METKLIHTTLVIKRATTFLTKSFHEKNYKHVAVADVQSEFSAILPKKQGTTIDQELATGQIMWGMLIFWAIFHRYRLTYDPDTVLAFMDS